MLLCEEILDNQCELEKIIMTLILIAATAKTAKTSFKSTLVLVSSNLVVSWVYEIHNHFQKVFHLFFYYRITDADETTNFILKQYLIKLKKLKIIVHTLNFNNSFTALIIILIFYNMWHYRTLKRSISLACDQDVKFLYFDLSLSMTWISKCTLSCTKRIIS